MTATPSSRNNSRWHPKSIALIVIAWAILQLGGLFTPGLLDDVDSVYIQIAREMLLRHDFVTPTIDGIRFFDKPPLMYWMAAGSMRLFGVHDWAARLPLALGVLALLFSVYALANRFFAAISPENNRDRAGLYAALITVTSLGPYLYTRFYIPDIVIALWMTLSVHLFLIALERITINLGAPRLDSETWVRGLRDSSLIPCLAFAAVMALDVLTKGLIGIVFPLGFVVLYLAITHRLKLLVKLHLVSSTLVFLLIAAPWHILAALHNPAIPMPAGVGLPARAGWAWFYLYNEHIARFLGKRIPHDYGQVPVPLFWLLLLLWLLPWVAFLPAALRNAFRTLVPKTPGAPFMSCLIAHEWGADAHQREAALSLLLWPAIILGFFTLSSRQEYYHLPALPALAILVGGLLTAADSRATTELRQALRGALWFLVPLGALVFLICGYFAVTAPTPHAGLTLNDALNSNPANYNLSLGHLYDLTGTAMGFFRGPLIAVALGMLTLGPIAYLVRRRSHTFAANLLIAAAMTVVLLAAHEGLVRFYPILGSKDLALQIEAARQPGDLILIDGELTAGSTLLFYTNGTHPVLLVNGHINGPWFGSFWPDSPHIFADDTHLHQLWSGPQRIFLLTYHPTERTTDLSRFGPVHDFADSGGKTILTNH
jgi:4-amino-4-deoxy-L-arabinose transferase-like glycosyltransferase